MTSAAPVAKTETVSGKTVHRPRCKHCRKQFRTTSTVKVYCTTQCQRDATKKKRRVSRVSRATNSAFLYHLAYECERAGTLQILSFHSVESLVALYEVYKLKLKANRYGECKDFEISHIHPVKGHDNIGLYCAENLVVSPTQLNRDHSTQHFGGGRSIPRASLQSRHSVEKGASRKATVARIIKYLGADLVEEVVRIAKIQPTQRAKVLSWLRDNLDPSDQQHRTWLESLDDMCTKALSALKAKIEGKDESKFKLKTRTFGALEVLLMELERHAQFRPELLEVHNAMYDAISLLISKDFSSSWRPYWTLLSMVENLQMVPSMRPLLADSDLLQGLFDCLHGKPAGAFLSTLPGAEAPLERATASDSDAPVVVLATLPVSFDFASELDTAFVPDIVPVLLQAHSATRERSDASYDTDPVPW